MKNFEITKKIHVVCDYKKTRNGFKHTATLLIDGREREQTKVCYLNRTWEVYDYQSVLQKIIRTSNVLSESEKKKCLKFAETGGKQENSPLKTASLVALMGDIFGNTQQEKNDWKKRMLATAPGISFPENWDELPEEEKKRRLDGAVEIGLGK